MWTHTRREWTAIYQRAIKGDAGAWDEIEHWADRLRAADKVELDEVLFVLDLLASFSPEHRRRIRNGLTRPALIGLWKAARSRDPEVVRVTREAGKEFGLDFQTMVNPETISDDDAIAIMQVGTAGGLKN
jgi:hypothetical protein